MNAGLNRLHRIALVMDGRSRASEIKDFVDLDVKWKTYVMPHQLEAWVREQMMHVTPSSGVEVIHTDDMIATLQKTLAEVRANKSGAARHQRTTFA